MKNINIELLTILKSKNEKNLLLIFNHKDKKHILFNIENYKNYNRNEKNNMILFSLIYKDLNKYYRNIFNDLLNLDNNLNINEFYF